MEQTASPQEPVAAGFFYDRPNVQRAEIPVGPGIPLGIEQVTNPELGVAGAYGAWGTTYDNARLPELVEQRLGRPLAAAEKLNLAELGFTGRHHLPPMAQEEHVAVELAAGERLLRAAIAACGWQPEDVEAVLLGMTSPIVPDFVQRICAAAGVPARALKVSVHKACDGSVGALNLALNPALSVAGTPLAGLAQRLLDKKVLVGGFEGLSRVLRSSHDAQALQLFGTGAGMLGLIPGKTMRFLAGASQEVYDADGVLQVHMNYPHANAWAAGDELLQVSQEGENHLRVAGRMHEPSDPQAAVVMAEPMGMVKLFVRSGVTVVREAYRAYEQKVSGLGAAGKGIAVTIAHHANLKINQMKGKHLEREGITLEMPWLVSDFGNVSAASNMIAFLRWLPRLRPGDHVLVDGFGAGTYYDVLAVEVCA